MVGFHGVEGGVAAGGDQGHERLLQIGLDEVGGRDVALEVVHRDEREAAGVGEAFGSREADE